MEDMPAIYLGQVVSKEHFRAFIYGAGDVKKLVNSWDEYEKNIATGIWFATKEEAKHVFRAPSDDEIESTFKKAMNPKKSKKSINESPDKKDLSFVVKAEHEG